MKLKLGEWWGDGSEKSSNDEALELAVVLNLYFSVPVGRKNEEITNKF